MLAYTEAGLAFVILVIVGGMTVTVPSVTAALTAPLLCPTPYVHVVVAETTVHKSKYSSTTSYTYSCVRPDGIALEISEGRMLLVLFAMFEVLAHCALVCFTVVLTRRGLREKADAARRAPEPDGGGS